MMIQEKDKPTVKSKAVAAMSAAIRKCRNVGGGWGQVKAAGYLPQHPKETPADYQIRLERPTFFSAFARTLDGLTGLVFRRDPVLSEDVPPRIVSEYENIDLRGTHGDVFLRDLFRDAAEVGMSFVMVDMPENTAENLAQEEAQGIRPYWVHYKVDELRNWRSTVINGKTVLQQITFEVTTAEPDGEYGDKEVKRWRTYRLGPLGVEWEVKKKDDNADFVLESSGILKGPTEIPIAVVYGKRTGFYTSTPPLEALVDLNLLHYYTNADYFHAMHIADCPIPVVTGVDTDNKIVIGPNASLLLPEGADAKYLETAGTALGHTREALQDLEGQMAAVGLNMLAKDKRAAETAEARRIGKAEGDSALTAMARSLGDAAEVALGFHAQFIGLDGGGSIDINRDYEDQSYTPEEMNALSAMVSQGQLSLETMWALLIQGERLPEDFDPEEERERIAADVGTFEPAEPVGIDTRTAEGQ